MTRRSKFGLDSKSINLGNVAFCAFVIGLIVSIIMLFISWRPNSKSTFGETVDIEFGEIVDREPVYSSPAGVIRKDLSKSDLSIIQSEVKNYMNTNNNKNSYNYITYYDDGGFRVYNSNTKPLINKPVIIITITTSNDNIEFGEIVNSEPVYSSPAGVIRKNLDKSDLSIIKSEVKNYMNTINNKNSYNYITYYDDGGFRVYQSNNKPPINKPVIRITVSQTAPATPPEPVDERNRSSLNQSIDWTELSTNCPEYVRSINN